MGTLYPCSSSVPMMTPSDAWHRDALGPSSESTWIMLQLKGELSPGQLAKNTGRSKRTIQRSLKKLWIHALATPSGAGNWTAAPASNDYLQQIAARYGTLGAGERRKARHKKERTVHANYLIRKQKNNWDHKHANKGVIVDGHCSICMNNKINSDRSTI